MSTCPKPYIKIKITHAKTILIAAYLFLNHHIQPLLSLIFGNVAWKARVDELETLQRHQEVLEKTGPNVIIGPYFVIAKNAVAILHS